MDTKKSMTRDMTNGSIIKQICLFSLPLMVGNLFQMLYNTVDIIVVGNFVSKQALAAVGSTTVIINMLVFFFNGFSIGAGAVISRLFGARDTERLHMAVETTIAVTFIISVLFTVIGVGGVRFMLLFMSTPDDVFADATVYLKIYFAGISGLLVYNIGSAILRAVGDSFRPLLFLIITSVLNIILDLVFVIRFHMGVAGVAYATILSQFISAVLILILLSRSSDIYRLIWQDLQIDFTTLRQIFSIGMPAGIQSTLTAFSNVFVQSYINVFGSSVMAGWSCYNKLDQFIFLPMHSMAMAATIFVGQNIGARKEDRAHKGIAADIILTVSVTGIFALALFVFAVPAVGMFTKSEDVIRYGVLFIHTNIFFTLFNCVSHTLAGGIRGLGDGKGPMIIMLSCFVVIRQIYLFWVTRFVANTPALVGFGYPVGWMSCCAVEVLYYIMQHYRKRSV